MGIGKQTLRAVYDMVSESGVTSRKETSDALGISTVAAHKAVDTLVLSGLLSVEKDSLHNTSPRGRKSEDVVISPDKLCLIIDFCKKNINFSISPLYSKIDSFEIIPYSDLQDLEINLDLATSHISRFLERNQAVPSFVAVAIPEFDCNFSIKDCENALANAGLKPDLTVSGASAASEFFSSLSKSEDRYAFVSIDNHAWGCSSAEPCRMILWESIKVGAHHGESFASVLQYEKNEQNLCIYARRFINAIDAVLAPDKIYVSASSLPDPVMEKLAENGKISDISSDTPVLNGLLRLSKDRFFHDIIGD